MNGRHDTRTTGIGQWLLDNLNDAVVTTSCVGYTPHPRCAR